MLCFFVVNYMYAMNQSLELVSIACIEKMRLLPERSILNAFNRILYLPIQSKNDHGECIARSMSRIIPEDYSLLDKNYKEKKKHIDNSIIWTFAQLPIELQKKIVEFMMDRDQKAANIFIRIPFLYALKEYKCIKHKEHVCDNYKELWNEKGSFGCFICFMVSGCLTGFGVGCPLFIKFLPACTAQLFLWGPPLGGICLGSGTYFGCVYCLDKHGCI